MVKHAYPRGLTVKRVNMNKIHGIPTARSTSKGKRVGATTILNKLSRGGVFGKQFLSKDLKEEKERATGASGEECSKQRAPHTQRPWGRSRPGTLAETARRPAWLEESERRWREGGGS